MFGALVSADFTAGLRESLAISAILFAVTAFLSFRLADRPANWA